MASNTFVTTFVSTFNSISTSLETVFPLSSESNSLILYPLLFVSVKIASDRSPISRNNSEAFISLPSNLSKISFKFTYSLKISPSFLAIMIPVFKPTFTTALTSFSSDNLSNEFFIVH